MAFLWLCLPSTTSAPNRTSMRCWPLSARCKDCASLILAAARASCRAPWRSWAPRSLATIHSSPRPSRPRGAGSFRLAKATADAIPEPDHSADLVLFVFSLHHVPGAKLEGALTEARRLLRPLGRLYVAEPLPQGPHQYIMELFHDETAVRKAAADALSRFARPRFAVDQISTYTDVRSYSDFGAFSERMIANMRFNGYTRGSRLGAGRASAASTRPTRPMAADLISRFGLIASVLERRHGVFGREAHLHADPHTSCAVSTTSLSFAISSSTVMALPPMPLEKPHCGDSASCSSGT